MDGRRHAQSPSRRDKKRSRIPWIGAHGASHAACDEARGIGLAGAAKAASRHDLKRVRGASETIQVKRPRLTPEHKPKDWAWARAMTTTRRGTLSGNSASTYLARLHLALSIMTWRATGLLG